MFFQVTAGTAVDKNPILEYQHRLSQSGGHIIPTWILLVNQFTVDVFSYRRLLKNTRKSDRALTIFQQEDKQLQASRGTSRYMEQCGSTQEASLTSCPSQRWQKNTGCTTTAPAKTSSSSTFPEESSGPSHNVIGVSSNPTWLRGRGQYSLILKITINLIIMSTTTLGLYWRVNYSTK